MGTLPAELERFLHDFIARRRRLAIAKSVALAVAAGLAVALVACLADRFLKLPAGLRAVLLAVDFIVVVLILRRPMLDALASHAHWVEAARQIESLEPAFAQRLITVTSQLQSPEIHRGSPGMLAALVGELTHFTSGRRAGELLGVKRIARSLTLAGCFLAVTLAAGLIPWLNLPRLMARFTRPWANIPPVTTTQLTVEPGHTRIQQGKPLTVIVTAAHLDESPVRLFLKEPDGWSQHELARTPGGQFAVEIPPRDRSTRYYVTGGDARSDTFDVQVMTVPGLAEVRARVQYPAYLQWPERPLTLAEGRLEVPAGSEVALSLVGTEPLADATLQPKDGKPIVTAASVDPAVRTARLPVPKDVVVTATLVSHEGITQTAAQPIVLKAIADRPPLVRLLVPDQELRLYPTDVLTTACQAMDDYGIDTLTLSVKVNDRPPILQPIPISGDRRRIEMTIDCDLAGINAAVGDVLAVTLVARDGAGQQRSSDVLRAVISPRSFDLNAYLRQTELKTAQKLLAEAHQQLAAARDALNQPAAAIAKEGDRSLQLLGSAAQLAQQAQGSLMRAATRTDRRELGDAVAGWFDAAEHARAIAEAAADLRARGVEPGQIRPPVEQAMNLSRAASEQLSAVVKAQAALAIRDDLAASESVAARVERAQPADREKLQNAAKRLAAAAESAARDAGIDFGGHGMNRPGVEQAIAAASGALQAQPIAFEGPAREWFATLERMNPGSIVAERARHAVQAFEERLAAAAAVEMVRPDADFNRARDLSLAARAGETIAAAHLAVTGDAGMKQAAREYPDALRDLQVEHRLVRQPQPNSHQIAETARAARDKMRKWAGEVDPASQQADAKPVDEQQLALETAAAMQQKQFDRAKAVEAKRLDRAEQKKQQLAQATDASKRLEDLRQRQEQLARQTARASAEKNAKTLQQLAQAQQKLADDVQESRDALADEAGKPAEGDEKRSDTAVEAIAAARRALGELKAENANVRIAADPAQRSAKAKELDPSPVQSASEKLAAAAPVAEEARKQIDEKVLAEVRQMQQEARANNAGGVQQRSEAVDREIAEANKKLDAAEEKLAERDALAAAEAASQQAARQMAEATQEPPANEPSRDPGAKAPPAAAAKPGPSRAPMDAASKQAAQEAAQKAQARTLSALERAADRHAMTGGQARVRELPRVAELFSLLPLLDGPPLAAGAGATSARADLAAAREWGRLRPREDPQQTAVAPLADPPGYESSLRAYFEALGKEK